MPNPTLNHRMAEPDEAQLAADRDEVRRKIAAGLQSLRDGKGIDGPAFFAELDATLQALEHRNAG